MENIDPVYLLYPIIVVAFSFGLVLYWRFRRNFTWAVLVFSLVAYAGAIALKYIVQIPTFHAFDSAVGGSPIALGLYYGLQTVIFEVGGAFVVASYAVSHGKFKAKDAEGYGIGLSFWENGVYLGILTLINYVSYYAILSAGPSGISQSLYDTLIKNAPGLFSPTSIAFRAVGYAVLERVSSLLVHFSWGYLCVFAAIYKKKLFLAVALPMGLVDFLTPFASIMGVPVFEGVLFLLSLLCLTVALRVTSKVRKQSESVFAPTSQSGNK